MGLTNINFFEGKKYHVTLTGWSSRKLKRTARSSLSCEVQELNDMEDEMYITRLATWEFIGGEVKEGSVERIDKCVSKIPALTVIDAKSIYDTLTAENQMERLAEKRTALELLAYMHNSRRCKTKARWQHGGCNLADGMTKTGADALIREYLQTGQWELVKDGKALSNKKRKALGLHKFEGQDESETKLEEFDTLLFNAMRQRWGDQGVMEECEEEWLAPFPDNTLMTEDRPHW